MKEKEKKEIIVKDKEDSGTISQVLRSNYDAAVFKIRFGG